MEEEGVNTCSPGMTQLDLINTYKRQRGGRIQTVVNIRQEWENWQKPDWNELKEWIDKTIDAEPTMIYTHGGYTDTLAKLGKSSLEILAKAIDYIRKQGLPAGLGCHDIKVIEAADEIGLDPDFYYKTFHHDNYWSAHPREKREPWSVDSTKYLDHNKFHDNIYDLFPEKTIEIMKAKTKPWIAFKTLAAGAIHPESAFEYCFKNGADFLSVGMFDFQVTEDALIACRVLERDDIKNRKRPWKA